MKVRIVRFGKGRGPLKPKIKKDTPPHVSTVVHVAETTAYQVGDTIVLHGGDGNVPVLRRVTAINPRSGTLEVAPVDDGASYTAEELARAIWDAPTEPFRGSFAGPTIYSSSVDEAAIQAAARALADAVDRQILDSLRENGGSGEEED